MNQKMAVQRIIQLQVFSLFIAAFYKPFNCIVAKNNPQVIHISESNLWLNNTLLKHSYKEKNETPLAQKNPVHQH